MSELSKAKFSILCDVNVIFLVRPQGKFDSDHSILGVKGLNKLKTGTGSCTVFACK